MTDNKDIFSKAYKYDEAKKVQAAGLYPYFRPIEATTGSTVTVGGKKRVMIGSNNYLGLTHHPRVIEAAKKALDRYGVGCTGSRFLNGNLALHEELEHRLAKFLDREAALVFSTGFFVNQGTLGCLVGRSDVMYFDRENHASLVEGTRIALGDTLKYRHNDMADLERMLKDTRDKYDGALIVTDGVFSMSGDIVNLPKLTELAKRYNARIYCDCAHALGVLGPRGEGTPHHFGLQKEVDLVMGTFSKSFASIGGFVAGNKDVIDFIKHKARPFMFSAAIPPASAAAVLECLTIAETEPEHIRNLWKNARKMSKALSEMGYNTLGSTTPIIPLLIGDDLKAFAFTQRLYEHGVFATPVIRPAVPDGCALIRTSYMASHKDEELDYALGVLEKLGKEFGILEKSNQEQLAQLARQHFGHNLGIAQTALLNQGVSAH